MIEQLFGSKTRVKLLQLFYQNPNRSFYVREITRKIDEQINSVRRELANMLSLGIISSETTNNRLYYEVDQTFEHYNALASIFAGKKFKTSTKKKVSKSDEETDNNVAEETQAVSKEPFIQDLSKAGNARLVVYTGQFTRDDITGVDIVIVGDMNHSAVDNLIAELENTEKKELRYSIFSPGEFNYRKEINDKFIANLELAKKIIMLNKDRLI
jgi:hypothetical protein